MNGNGGGLKRHYDVIIIGTAAGGGTLAYKLAPSGKSILLIERGGYMPREQDNWSTKAVVLDAKYQAREQWLDKDGKPFHPGIHYYVGGQTKMYGAALVRFRKQDFSEIRHHGGVSPAWPIAYEDLEPYYTEAEHLYQVHGNRGEDPTDPPASAPYLWPALEHEPRIQQLHDDLARIGYRPLDHTAIVVADTDASLGFYRDRLGLKIAGESENYGTEQERLNNVFGARLRITALRAPEGIGIELLEYRAPTDGRPYPPDLRPNDLAFWRTRLVTREIPNEAVSLPNHLKGLLIRDPDGHAMHLVSPSKPLAAAGPHAAPAHPRDSLSRDGGRAANVPQPPAGDLQ